MGLDIYLYRYDNFNDTQEREKKHRDYSEALWNNAGDYDTLTDEIKSEVRAKDEAYAAELGLDKWGSDETHKVSIEEDHPDFPDHYFKIGYFRSSYNEGGIERILRNLNLPTMSDCFNYNGDYNFKPDWEESLKNVEDLIIKFEAKGGYRVSSVSSNIFRVENDIKSESKALEIFLNEKERNPNCDYNYSNAQGEFSFFEPKKVLALIPGTSKIFREQDCVYVITESDNTWYINALKIVRDTCKYVLSKEDKEQYYLHWSG